jgi:hypothetical protein
MIPLAKTAALTSSVLLVGGFLAYQGGYWKPEFTAQAQSANGPAPQLKPAEGPTYLISGPKSGAVISPSQPQASAPTSLLPGSKSYTGITQVQAGASPQVSVQSSASQPAVLMDSSKSKVPLIQQPSNGVTPSVPSTTLIVPADSVRLIGGSKSTVPLIPAPTGQMTTITLTGTVPVIPTTQPLAPSTQPYIHAGALEVTDTMPTAIMPSSKVLVPVVPAPNPAPNSPSSQPKAPGVRP